MTLDVERTWVISDTHFLHDNIAKFSHRPTYHDRLMVEEWQATVPADGTVLHLGDLVYRGEPEKFKLNIAPRLTGKKKYMLMGNHDKQKPSFYESCGFEVIEPPTISWNDWVISFGHYPYEGKPPKKHLHIHGHVHNNGYQGGAPVALRQVNISVEQTKLRPVHLGALLRSAIGPE